MSYLNLVNILTAPKTAFENIRLNPTLLFPLSILAIGVLVFSYASIAFVDQVFLMEEIIDDMGRDLSNEQVKAMREMPASESGIKFLPVFIGPVGLLAGIMACAVYLFLVSKFFGSLIRFRQWFSFVSWVFVPKTLSVIAGITAIIIAPKGKISPFDMNPLAIGNLFNISSDIPAFTLTIEQVDIVSIWITVLAIIGYSLWLNKGVIFAGIVVVSPLALLLSLQLYLLA